MDKFPAPLNNTRIGFHYYPDANHYRESDLRAWAPELASLGARWLILMADPERAVPEPFLRGLIGMGIEPVIHLHLPIRDAPAPAELEPVFSAYARWGVHYVVLFDRPNRRKAWTAQDWSQGDLVERFLDVYLPPAEAAVRAGLFPVFPPLQPGGDYWDTAFLRSAMQGLGRRATPRLLSRLVIGAYSWPDNRPLNWGSGGPERWPRARPYFTPPGEQDHLGFRIFDWYSTIGKAELGRNPPVLVVGTGAHIGDRIDPSFPEIDAAGHAERNLTLARYLVNDPELCGADGQEEPLPERLLAACFWLLTAGQDSPYLGYAWYRSDGETLPAVGALRQWMAAGRAAPRPGPVPYPVSRPIAHYLLLPTYEWGISEWHLEAVRPYVMRHRPTIGFSPAEAAQATRVTLVGGLQAFSAETLDELRAAGCRIETIEEDGTTIAAQVDPNSTQAGARG